LDRISQKIKIMKVTNLWNKLGILSGNILEVKIRISKFIILDLFISTNRFKLMILNIGFESK
jgi:hypothetical protein